MVFVHPDLVADQVQALSELADPAGRVLRVLAQEGPLCQQLDDPGAWCAATPGRALHLEYFPNGAGHVLKERWTGWRKASRAARAQHG